MKSLQTLMPETDKVFQGLSKRRFPSFLELMSSLNEISDRNCDEDAPESIFSSACPLQPPPVRDAKIAKVRFLSKVRTSQRPNGIFGSQKKT